MQPRLWLVLAKVTLGAGRLPYRSVRFAWGAMLAGSGATIWHRRAQSAFDARRLAGGWLVLAWRTEITCDSSGCTRIGPSRAEITGRSALKCCIRSRTAAFANRTPGVRRGEAFGARSARSSLTTACERVLCPCRARDGRSVRTSSRAKMPCAARARARRVPALWFIAIPTSRARTWYFRTLGTEMADRTFKAVLRRVQTDAITPPACWAALWRAATLRTIMPDDAVLTRGCA